MNLKKEHILKKDVPALEIPLGNAIKLKKGTRFRITQNLGGAFTVFTKSGHLARVEGRFAQALGQKKLPTAVAGAKATSLTPAALRARVKAQLKNCYDPEIPVNILDLGLIYGYRVKLLKSADQPRPKKLPAQKSARKAAPRRYAVWVQMTLTMPGCGMGDVLAGEVKRRLMALPGVKKVNIKLTMDPPWDQSRLSPAARLQLGL